MAYHGVDLKDSISIKRIYSIHYFEYMSNFSFAGESHDFWEFIFVDKGQVGVTAGDAFTVLKKGEILFHEPGEFHNVKAVEGIAPNLVVISFDCPGEAMEFFRKRLFKADSTERNLLANIIMEARHCFACRLDDPYLQNMPQKESDLFGSEQLIRLYLEQFLIHLTRRYLQPSLSPREITSDTASTKSTREKSDAEIFRRVTDYLEANLSSHVTIEQICRDNLIGRSQLQKLFQKKTSLGVIEYFLPHEDQRGQRDDPHRPDELHPDLRDPGVHLHPLLLPAVQKSSRHDPFRVCLLHQGRGRRKLLVGDVVFSKIPRPLQFRYNSNNSRSSGTYRFP